MLAATSALPALSADMLKAVAFINGGAAVATIVCIGQVVRDLRPLALSLVAPLAVFGFGLTVAAFAVGWTYFSQAEHARDLTLRSKIETEPFVVESAASRDAAGRAARFRTLAFAAVMVAVASATGGFALAGLALWRGLA